MPVILDHVLQVFIDKYVSHGLYARFQMVKDKDKEVADYDTNYKTVLREAKKVVKTWINKATQCDSGNTAMHQACYNGHNEIILILHRYGADLKAANK